MKRKISILSSSLFLLMLSACINLKTLNSYTSVSVDGLKTYSETGFSFEKICQHDCLLNKKTDRISAVRESSMPAPIDSAVNCNCANYTKADRAFDQLNVVIENYFEGLYKLSSDDVLDFNYDTLADALQKSNLIKVDEKEVKAFNGLVKVLTKFVVDVKRRKDIKTIVVQADKNVSDILSKMEGIAGQMAIMLDNEIALEYNYYKEMMIQNKISEGKLFSSKEILDAENAFLDKKEMYKNDIKAIQKYAALLKTIREGYETLVKNADKVDKEELKNFISSYTTQIKAVRASFENLKTK